MSFLRRKRYGHERAAGSLERMVLLRLIDQWRLEAKDAHEKARGYDKAGSCFAAQQLHAEADALECCARDLEGALAQQNND